MVIITSNYFYINLILTYNLKSNLNCFYSYNFDFYAHVVMGLLLLLVGCLY